MDTPRTFTVKLTHTSGMKIERRLPENELAEYLELATEVGWVIVRVRMDGGK